MIDFSLIICGNIFLFSFFMINELKQKEVKIVLFWLCIIHLVCLYLRWNRLKTIHYVNWKMIQRISFSYDFSESHGYRILHTKLRYFLMEQCACFTERSLLTKRNFHETSLEQISTLTKNVLLVTVAFWHIRWSRCITGIVHVDLLATPSSWFWVFFHSSFLAVSLSSFKAFLAITKECTGIGDEKHSLVLYNKGSFLVSVVVFFTRSFLLDACMRIKTEMKKAFNIFQAVW